MKNLTVLLLAGGKSSRFWPLPNKLTLTFLGRTLLEHQIEFLDKVGFKNVVLVTTSEIAHRFAGQDIQVIVQKGEGMGAAVLSASDLIKNKPVLMVLADDIVEKTLFEKFLQTISETQHNLLAGFKTKEYYPGGYLVFEGKRIARIHEKPGIGNEPSNYVYMSCNYFTNGSTLLKYLNKAKNKDPIRAYEAGLSEMMEAGEIFEMMEYQNTFIPVKYPWQTLSVMEYFLKKNEARNISKHTQIHKTASIVGSVVLEAGVKVMEYAKIVGPTYIGTDAVVGNHALIRSSMIGENTIVGFGSEITRSFIGNNCWFHTNYIGDSVISDNVGVGAGAVFANLRLDETNIYSLVKGEKVDSRRTKLGAMVGEGARIGIEAQLMPGVKVGKSGAVGPGVILQHDLPDRKRILVKQTHVIMENTTTPPPDRNRFRIKL